MAHQLSQRADGSYEFAFSGDRKQVWHGLGQAMEENQSLDQWKVAAGLDWEVLESKVMYQAGLETKTYDDRKVLFRSDSSEAMSVVGSEYKIVQPSQVIDFFSDLVGLHGLQLSAAGSVFGGRRFWATADLGEGFETVPGDVIKGQLLLATSIDGTLATVAKICSTRVVCQNTLTAAMGESSQNLVKVSHRSTWDATQVKLNMGLISEGWGKFSEDMKKLAQIEVSPMDANAYFTKKFYDSKKSAEDQTWGAIKTVATLNSLFKNGTGSEFAPNSAYNILQAVTENQDHFGIRKMDAGRKFMDNSFGKGDSIKSEVYADLMDMYGMSV